MMKVAFFDASVDEIPYIQQWEQATGDEIIQIPDFLSKENVHLVAGCDAVSTKQIPVIDDEVYPQLAEFGIHHLALRSVGYNVVNFELANQYDLTITNVPAYSPRAIAENGLTVGLNLLRKLSTIQARMRRLDFTLPTSLLSDEIFTKTVGVIGVGRIGTATAQLYHALGANVLGYDPVYNAANEAFLTYTDLPTLLTQADIITIHTPLDESTYHLIGEPEFQQMKPGAIFINQARGGLVDTATLIQHLENGHLGGAGLDVLSSESEFFWKQFTTPTDLPADYQRLAALDNVIVTPHSAYYTNLAVQNMVRQSLTECQHFLTGEKLLYKVEP
ncbi:D-2-hydroxyacid dehydrogenase [Limosilactobacillus equigenerosi]|uniref:D-lactate dehydrogenase n=1 Tax=Limosilactobacillus equigenerosi DSM 18793 = JCM 14505 TaxID=1423742 RepID=A0A0R1UV76_9LACO|nr:D-2-hydroxyacid dehydrogenase [Limosilactobacillus equigenerosi]KRL95272.1 D-lactate dehydrogenase [Limosilactobacillus equigenerosi DSM 18793 = JCM 14505]